jgi:hypothetical protein
VVGSAPKVSHDGPLELERVLSVGLALAELERHDAELLERLELELLGKDADELELELAPPPLRWTPFELLESLAHALPEVAPWRPGELLAPGGPIPQGPLV